MTTQTATQEDPGGPPPTGTHCQRAMESHQKNRRWRLWRDLRGHRSGHQRTSGPQTRVGQAAQTGAQNGGGCPQEAAGPRTRLSIHWLWAQRPFQLRSDAIASQKPGRAEKSSATGRLFSFHHATLGLSDSEGDRGHPRRGKLILT